MSNLPWLSQYPAGVAADIDLDDCPSMAALLEQAVARFGDRIAFHQFGVNLTYRELDAYSARLAAYFQKNLQLKPGDRIALMLPNSLQHPIAMFAALRAGLTVVNVNPLYTAPELASLIKDSGARAIVVMEVSAATLQQALALVPIEHVIVARVAEMQSFPRSILVDYIVRKKKKLVPDWTIPGAIAFRTAMTARPAADFTKTALNRETRAFLQYTGGTTGDPKGAVLTHGNVVADVLIFAAWVRPVFRTSGEITLVALPLYHVAALVCQCLVSFHLGTRCVLVMNPRDIPSLVKDFATHRPTVFGGLNTLFTALMNNEAFGALDFSTLRSTFGGGTATQPAVAERWQKLTGTPVVEAYGLSEAAGAVTANPVTQTAFEGTIGVPLPSMRIEIRDEGGAALRAGMPGEIFVAGPVIMQGYFNRPEETAHAIGSDGFFATGDIGIMDERGVIRIVDRKRDMILVSGFNVYPNEVEGVLFRHPGILEVAVVGVADSQSGETPVAFVVKKEPGLTESDVIEFARTSLTAYKVPKQVVFVNDLPKTPVGKVLRRQLRDRLVSQI
ncbi:long-chain-fatty-acid--CoA ligase [Paraburkholderia guartelaensis]|uniref:Long-chain-fatty-acid--CoA ligase n=1 Tax=Paraburkholderia guartelaensis TaxID=2546446 RepID=A0A4R5LKR6_9BURK|nr:AMP-binding protein [Paraburkholderia guartelaensis]TDG10348.1 long-chain-fatty-acid--CoA ligase [Paraburkholderia guartelaensis]